MSDDKSLYRRDTGFESSARVRARSPSPPCLTPRRLYSPAQLTVRSLIDATPDELNSPSWLAGTVRTSRVGELGMVSGVSAAGPGAESLGAVHDGVGVAAAVNSDNSQVTTSCTQMSGLAEATFGASLLEFYFVGPWKPRLLAVRSASAAQPNGKSTGTPY